MQEAIIAGLDEAGRGALAGPVVAAACVFERKTFGRKKIPRITDSKMMTEEEREEAFLFLTEKCAYGIGIVDASVIDEIRILAATERAMQEAVKELSQNTVPTYLLIDGRDQFWFDIPHSSIIRGDQSESCIAAASIIAKVTRDRLMIEADQEYAAYGFASHKGYGTEEHQKCLKKRKVS